MLLALVIVCGLLLLAIVILLAQRCDIDRLMLDNDVLERAEDRLCKRIEEFTCDKRNLQSEVSQLQMERDIAINSNTLLIREIESLKKKLPTPKPTTKRKKRSCQSTVE